MSSEAPGGAALHTAPVHKTHVPVEQPCPVHKTQRPEELRCHVPYRPDLQLLPRFRPAPHTGAQGAQLAELEGQHDALRAAVGPEEPDDVPLGGPAATVSSGAAGGGAARSGLLQGAERSHLPEGLPNAPCV